MPKALLGILGSFALAAAAVAQPVPAPLTDKALWYGIVGSGPNPSQPVMQIGPFRDRAACEAALAIADKRNVIESGVCVPDRTESHTVASPAG